VARLRSGIAETVDEAVNALARAGAVVREFTLPEAEAAYAVFLQGSLSAIELRSFLDRGLPDWLAPLDPVIAPAVRNAESVSATDYLARLARLRALARSAAPRLDAVDVIAAPTLCLTPPLMSDVADADSHLRVNRRIVRNTVAANYLGLCAIKNTSPPISTAAARATTRRGRCSERLAAAPASSPARCCRRRTAYAMIRRRAAGITTKPGNHSFRATGITAYLKDDG
jgi:Asp-tRNA(Asn)/Glu-tRNA(Gln) amidotransferase A subunit family amidase